MRFANLAELRKANEAAGGNFFEAGDLARDRNLELRYGRWLIAVRSDPERFVVYRTEDTGRITYIDTFREWKGADACVDDRSADDWS